MKKLLKVIFPKFYFTCLVQNFSKEGYTYYSLNMLLMASFDILLKADICNVCDN